MPKTSRNDQRFDVPVCLPLNGDAVDQLIYLANRSVRLVSVKEVHAVAGTHGSAVTLQLKKCTGTTAAASGTAILSTAFDLKGTANTVQSGAFATTANIQNLAAGDRVSVDVTGTTTSVAGVLLTLTFEYL